MARLSTVATLAGLIVATSACATHRAAKGPQPERVAITVKNTNWMEIDFLWLQGGKKARVGSVTGLTTATFRVPANFAPDGVLQFMVDPIGSAATFVTDKIVVSPGQYVELTIASVLRMSTFAVWSR